MTTYHHFALTIRQRTLIGAHLVAVPIEGTRRRAFTAWCRLDADQHGGRVCGTKQKKGGPKPSRCSFDELGEYRTRQRR